MRTTIYTPDIPEWSGPIVGPRLLATIAWLKPTNNHHEQQIRHCVIDRRRPTGVCARQGTRGDVGQRYHERMWTAIATCKKQNRNFFSFLLASISAQLRNQHAPSLLTN
jgi:transposase